VPSPDAIVRQRTYDRWAENIAGRGKTARLTGTRSGGRSLAPQPSHTRSSVGSATEDGDKFEMGRNSSVDGSRDPLSRQEEGYTRCESPVDLSAPPSAFLATHNRRRSEPVPDLSTEMRFVPYIG